MRPAAASGARKGHGAGAARPSGHETRGQPGRGKGSTAVKAAQQQKQQQQQQPAARQDPDEDDTNAGFGKYIRSEQGIEMMKLFVIANTIVMFLTMAWPQMQQSYQILRSLIFAEDEDGSDL